MRMPVPQEDQTRCEDAIPASQSQNLEFCDSYEEHPGKLQVICNGKFHIHRTLCSECGKIQFYIVFLCPHTSKT